MTRQTTNHTDTYGVFVDRLRSELPTLARYRTDPECVAQGVRIMCDAYGWRVGSLSPVERREARTIVKDEIGEWKRAHAIAHMGEVRERWNARIVRR